MSKDNNLRKVSDQEFFRWFSLMGLNEDEIAFLFGVDQGEVLLRLQNMGFFMTTKDKLMME